MDATGRVAVAACWSGGLEWVDDSLCKSWLVSDIGLDVELAMQSRNVHVFMFWLQVIVDWFAFLNWPLRGCVCVLFFYFPCSALI